MSDEKPLPATASRLRKARREGDLPQAPELLALVAFAAGIFVLQHSLPELVRVAQVLLERLIFAVMRATHDRSDPLAPLTSVMGNAIGGFILATGGVIGAAAITAIIVARLIGSIGWHAPKIDLARLAPAANLKKIFSSDTVTAVVRALCISALLLVAISFNIVHTANHALGILSTAGLTGLAGAQVMNALWCILLIGGIFALVEARASLTKWHKKLRMSFEEIKREYREQNGDPHQRSQRKRRHRRLMRGGKAAITRSTVIVTNPTHIAIALEYNPPHITVPLVVARAADDGAAYVRKLARAAGVPIIEAVTLARMLYAQTEEGDPIPLDAYALVAPIIASVLATSVRKEEA